MLATLAARTIPQVLAAAASTWPDDHAIEDGDLVLTFSQLRAQVLRAARALAARGITRGDHVAIWAPNMWEWVVAGLAIHEVGAAIVPINTRYKGAEARYILDKSRAKLLFTVDGFLGLDFVGMLQRPDLDTVVFRKTWDAFLDAQAPVEANVGPEDLSDILFTSGTTGRPKGVVCTHAQSTRAYQAWSEVIGLRHGDRYLVVAPFFHCFGYKAGWFACLIRGATILPQPVFDIPAVLARIPADRVTMLPGPPALYQSLLQHDLTAHDLSSLRLAVTGAATIPVKLIHRMRDVLGFDTVITGYGLTEASGIVTMCRDGDAPELIARTSGRAIPGVEVRITGPHGEEVPRGEPGEVRVRGYNVMRAYFEEPEHTTATLRDGWLHTGDVGIMDDAGNIRITDRIKDMFIVGGFNAYPAEIEHTLVEHPAIREAAVIGVPHDRLGEVGMAFVVLSEAIDDDTLTAWCREHMANFKVPRHFQRVDALPRNASTKVMKFELRKRAGV
jgi:acyl-CoA synthetase (AMP-forming)/AMP-acid ligase II